MIILALDLATNSGFAIGVPEEPMPIYGSVAFAKPGASVDAILGNAQVWLIETLKRERPDLIVYEKPLPNFRRIGQTNSNATLILNALPGILRACAFNLGLYNKVRDVTVLDVRNHFLGSCKLERKKAKALTIKICNGLGWKPQDDNAADALAIWNYQCSRLKPELALRATPLFMRKSIPGQNAHDDQISPAGTSTAGANARRAPRTKALRKMIAEGDRLIREVK
jgi:hypothetical protein